MKTVLYLLNSMDNETHAVEILHQLELQTSILEKILKELTEPREIFSKPTLDEIKDYLKARESPIDPQSFYDYNESVNWMIGKKKMKNWHSAISTWEKREPKKKGSNERVLKDGTRVINKFGTWVDADNPNVQINLSYYPELTKD